MMKRYLLLFFMSMQALGNSLETADVKIGLISAYDDGRALLVQTNPRHNIDGLSCSKDFWLTLDQSSPGYETMLAILLSAQASKTPVTVIANDSGGEEFCRLQRITITQ